MRGGVASAMEHGALECGCAEIWDAGGDGRNGAYPRVRSKQLA